MYFFLESISNVLRDVMIDTVTINKKTLYNIR